MRQYRLGNMRWIFAVLCMVPLMAACSRTNLKHSYQMYEMGNDSLRRGELIQATSYFVQAKDMSPKDPDVAHMLAVTYLARYEIEGDEQYLGKAEALLKEAVLHYQEFESQPDQEFGRLTMSEARVNLSSIYLRKGQLDLAIEQAGLAVQDPLYRSPDKANFNLAWAYYQKGKSEKAISHLEIAIRQNRTFSGAYKALGEVYMSLKRYPQALHNLRLATQIYPQYAEAYFLMATIYQRQNQRQQAGQFFKRCYDSDPNGKFGLQCKPYLR